jgi:phosphatidylserine/phosphatidylglycerophosphate/cardiolipin synthase-like enzyme
VKAALAALACSLALAAAAAGPAPGPRAAGAAPRVEAYFTPGDEVDRVIAERISRARSSVQVEAYLFTNRRIAAALAKAAQRGLEVELIGDAKQHEAGGLPVLGQLGRAGVRIWLQGEHAAFHNKVVLIDAQTRSPVVVTGSYNFTQAAQARNAENIVVISGERQVAARYARDFERHRAGASRLQ